MSFEVDGMEEMLKQIESMGKNVEQVKKKALKAGGEILKTAMESRINVSNQNDQHLKDNIIVGDILQGEDGQDYALVGPVKKDLGDPFFYGRMLEFGTVKMSARPFAEPATLEKKQAVLDKIADVIRSELNE